MVAGSCSALVTLEVRDSFGNVSPVAAGATVGLTAAPSANFLFYSDATCTTAVTGVPIAPNGSTASFYFRGTGVGAVEVTAAATGLGSVDQTETLSPAPALQADASCPRRRPSPPATARGRSPCVRSTRSETPRRSPPPPRSPSPRRGLSFYSNAGCTTVDDTVSIPNGGTTSAPAMYFRGTTAGNLDVTAAASTLSSAIQTEVIEPDVASVLAFTSTEQTLNAGAARPKPPSSRATPSATPRRSPPARR